MARLRGSGNPNQPVGIQIQNIKIVTVFLVEFFLHRIGNLIETAASLLVASVIKISGGHEADMRTRYSQALQKSFSRCLFNLFLISLFFPVLRSFLHFPCLFFFFFVFLVQVFALIAQQYNTVKMSPSEFEANQLYHCHYLRRL